MAQNGLFPVTYARHGHLYWKRFTSFEFASGQPECAVVMHEIPQAAVAFPIVFQETERGVEPMVLLSLSADLPSPFVSKDGRWLAAYIPSSLRCHPFQAVRVDGERTDKDTLFQLLVDETSGLVTGNSKEEAFFDENGALSPELSKVKAFLQACVAASQETLKLCQILSTLDLFEPVETHGSVELPPGTLGITTSQIPNLSQAEKVVLMDSGALRLIHAHQISLSHCDWLARVQQQMALRDLQAKYTENSDISGFLCAMADAQNDDFSGTGGV